MIKLMLKLANWYSLYKISAWNESIISEYITDKTLKKNGFTSKITGMQYEGSYFKIARGSGVRARGARERDATRR